MFNNQKYKSFALQQLKGRWGIPIIISAIITVVTSIFAMPDFIRSFEQLQNLEALATTTVTTSSNTSIISSLIQTIVSGIFTIAALNVYIQMTRSPEPVSFSLFIIYKIRLVFSI